MIARLFLISGLIAGAASASAQIVEHMESPTAVIDIVGVTHSAIQALALDEIHFSRRFDSASVVGFELLQSNETTAAAMRKLLQPQGASADSELPTNLKEKLLAAQEAGRLVRVNAALRAHYCLSWQLVRPRFSPSKEAAPPKMSAMSVEGEAAKQTKFHNIKVVAIEPDAGLNACLEIPKSTAQEYLEAVADDVNGALLEVYRQSREQTRSAVGSNDACGMLDAYGNAYSITRSGRDAALNFMKSRNVGMAAEIGRIASDLAASSDSVPYFIIFVGAAHLCGPSGLPALLESYGFHRRQ